MAVNITELSAVLDRHRDREILVTGHRDPDGDCIGSITAMARGLRLLGYRATALNRDPVPYRYAFLDPDQQVRTPEQVDPAVFSMALVLDSSNLDRLGFDLHELFPNLQDVVNIDHHVSNTRFGTLNYVERHAAALCEVLYGILKDLGVPADARVANSLYTGITTDTGSFQYEATTADTLQIGAELIRMGADINQIRENVWENEPLNRLVVLSRVLKNLGITEDGKMAWISIGNGDIETYQLDNGDLEKFVDYPRIIHGVEVAVFFKEILPRFTKISIRTKTTVDADRLARIFGGGGHKRAAGCKREGPLEETMDVVLRAFRDVLGKVGA